MAPMTTSPYVRCLLRTADRIARESGMEPALYARTLLDVWQGAVRRRTAGVARLALLSAQRPPTPELVREFLRELERRVAPSLRAS